MGPESSRDDERTALLPVEEVVPERSVLTELARGFLLVHGSDRQRAAQFATTFLRERHRTAREPSPLPPVSFARLRLGLGAHGAIERSALGRPPRT